MLPESALVRLMILCLKSQVVYCSSSNFILVGTSIDEKNRNFYDSLDHVDLDWEFLEEPVLDENFKFSLIPKN